MAASLVIDVLVNSAKAVSGLNDVGGAATKQQSKFKRLGSVIGGTLAVGAVVAFGKASVEAASTDAEAQAILERQLKNTAGATDKQVAAAEDYISALSKQTAIADDELRPALATLTRGFGDTETAQKNLALATDIAAGTGKPLATVVDAMAKAAKGSTAPFAKLTSQSKDLGGEAQTLDELMAGAAKTFNNQAATAADTTAGKMRGAKIAMGEMSEQVGTALLPVVGKLSDVLSTSLIPAISSLFKFITDNIQWLGPLAAGILGVVAAMKLWNFIQKTFNLTLGSSPIGIIIAAIGILITVITLVIANWDKITAYLKKAWATIKRVALAVFGAIGRFFTNLWDSIKRVATRVWDGIKSAFSKVWNAIKKVATAIWDGIKAYFVAYWEALKTIFGTPIAWIKDKVGDVFRGIKATIKTVWDAVKTYFTTLWTDITAIFQTAWDWFDTFVEFLGTIGDTLADVWDTVTESLEGAWNGIIDGLKSAVNFFIRGVNTIIGGINSVIDKVNRINPFGDIGHIPTIPELASGGVLTSPTLFIGGERGTEIVTPERLLRQIMREERGTGTGAGYTLNIYPRRADVADVAHGFRRLELARSRR